MKKKILVVGGGLAGLACGRELLKHDMEVCLFEASDKVGGRVRTDMVDGFALDRGFQVLLTAYPEAKAQFDYKALNLGIFEPGALVRVEKKFHLMLDPRRKPMHALSAAMAPVGSMADKMRVDTLRREAIAHDPFEKGEPVTTSLERLQAMGFEEKMIDRFFRPFFGGVFLRRDLATASNVFDFLFRMFAEGDTALPAGGMGAIPHQIAAAFPEDAIRCNTPVAQITPEGEVVSEAGDRFSGDAVVVATDMAMASRLCGDASVKDRGGETAWCVYFDVPSAPFTDAILILNGEETSPINNLCFPSRVAKGYAPKGHDLASVQVLDSDAGEGENLEVRVREHLSTWFGAAKVDRWKHLRTYRIPNALPRQLPEDLVEPRRPVRLAEKLYVCGDHRDNASINGALESGIRTAMQIIGGSE